MVIYVLYLAQGSTIPSTTMKFTTTKCYLRAASSDFLNHKQLDLLLHTRVLEA